MITLPQLSPGPTWLNVAIALVAAPFLGMLLSGIDRKITARMQSRKGPPLLQPFYDTVKLFGKQPLALHRIQVMYVFLHLAFMMLTVALLIMGQDLLMILLVHAFSVICLVLGGMSVRSPYSRIGSQRKIMQMLAYEPILILLIFGIYLIDESFMGKDIIAQPKPLLLQMPLLFLGFLCAMAIKLNKSPFDVSTSHHAHQEIVRGITLEYSGPYLGLIEVAHFYETAILFFIVAMFWQTNLIAGLALASTAFFLMSFIDNAMARLSSMWMVRYMWTLPLMLAGGNLIWLL